jgi:hypothetical protein
MKLRYGILALVFLLTSSFPGQAAKVNKADLEATHILVGNVDDVESFFGVNERGDQIILSRIRVKALKWIKGDPSGVVEFVVEGGAVGELALRVSDIPEFEKGQRMRLLLKKLDGEFKFQEGEIDESTRFKPAKPAAGCCKTYAAWAITPVPYKVNMTGADGTESSALADIKDGAAAWVGVLVYGGRSSLSGAAYNGENTVSFYESSSGNAIAVTYLWYNKRTQAMLEFDMYFFEYWPFFSLNADETCSGGFYYRTIATHEFGHAVGIDHNRCVDSIMYPYASYCETNTLTAADLACLAKLY